jgi:hypothetical protein
MNPIPKIIKAGWWVDPPDGWRFGFPKEVPYDIPMNKIGDWMIMHGYPKEYANEYGAMFVAGTTITMNE